MIPILYKSDETAFDTNGLGILTDAADATVEEELNGVFELEMKYPVTGIHFSQIVRRSIILAEPNPISRPQPFRVYRITKPLNGMVKVYARHLAYDLKGKPVSPFSASGAALTLQGFKDYSVSDHAFDFYTDKSAAGNFSVAVPIPIWSLLGGQRGSVLDVFGGEYEFDRWSVNLLTRRGMDRGVSIRYGKNLTSFEQDENCASCCTGLYPYWTDTDGNVMELPEKVILAPGDYGYEDIRPMDFSDEWDETPTEEQLRARTIKYITDNEVGVPEVSWTVEFAALEQTEEYRGMDLLERVLLGDTVHVEFPEMNVSASARAVSVKYKPLLERYEKITLGRVRSNLADTIVKQKQEIEKKPNADTIERAVSIASKAILNAKGGSVRILDTDGDGKDDTIYIADNPDPAQAKKVWRWNYEGWAASKTGYDGPFTMAATLEAGLLADFVTAANLVAGTIQSKDGESFFLDLDNGILRMKAMEEIEGTISEIKEDISKIDGIDGVFFYIKYSQYADGHEMTDAPDENTVYMGTCSTGETTAPTDYTKYTWVKIKGADGTSGTPGQAGADGKSQYFHVKYSNDGKTFTGNLVPTDLAEWVTGNYGSSGFFPSSTWVLSYPEMIPVTPETYKVRTNCSDSQVTISVVRYDATGAYLGQISTLRDNIINFADYTDTAFVRIKLSHTNSTTRDDYEALWESGNLSPEFFRGVAIGEELGDWMGTCVNDTETDPTEFDAYTWKKIVGDDGIDGADGKDGQSAYFYVKFSANANGNPMTETPQSDTKYMGVCSSTSETAPTDPSAYDWTQCRGNDGANGTPGQTGADGKTQYLHIKYSDDGKTFTGNMLPVDISAWESGYYLSKKYEQAYTIVSPLIPVEADTQYAVSKFLGKKTGIIHYSGEDGSSYVSGSFNTESSTGERTFTPGSTTTHIRICYRSDDTTDTFETFEEAFASGEIVPYLYLNSKARGEDLGAYIGTMVDFVEADSNNFDDYTWKKFTEDVDEELADIRQTVEERYTSAVNTAEAIILSALESYVQTSNYEEFRRTVETQFEVMAGEIEMNFTTTTEQITNVDGTVQTEFNKLYKYIKFSGETAIEIGSGNSAITLEIDNEKGIVFKKNGVQFGLWDGENFHTGNIVVGVNERAQFGNFAFVPRTDGSLSFLKVGG